MSCDLKCRREPGGKEFQSWGTEQLKALCLMVAKEVEGVTMWTQLDKYGGAR